MGLEGPSYSYWNISLVIQDCPQGPAAGAINYMERTFRKSGTDSAMDIVDRLLNCAQRIMQIYQDAN